MIVKNLDIIYDEENAKHLEKEPKNLNVILKNIEHYID